MMEVAKTSPQQSENITWLSSHDQRVTRWNYIISGVTQFVTKQKRERDGPAREAGIQ